MKKLSLVLIIIGFIIVVITLIEQFNTKNTIDSMISEYSDSEYTTFNEASTNDINPGKGYLQLQDAFKAESGSTYIDETTNIQSHQPSTVTPAATTSAAAITTDTPKKTSIKAKAQTKQTILGIIKIGKIKVNTVIVEGTQPNNLRSGIGHLPGTSEIGQPGNCALAGHRSYTFGHFFNRLNELVVGDEILISTKELKYRYKVYQILEVKPDDVSVLKGSKDESILTLITCTPIFIATHRLIIHARLEVDP